MFKIENALEKKEVKAKPKVKEKVLLVERGDGQKGYITEEQFIIAQKHGKDIKKSYVKQELIDFVKRIKKLEFLDGMDKHLCDHLLWLIEEKD